MRKLKITTYMLFLLALAYGIGYFQGKNKAYWEFSLEKCWVEDSSRGIVCYNYEE